MRRWVRTWCRSALALALAYSFPGAACYRPESLSLNWWNDEAERWQVEPFVSFSFVASAPTQDIAGVGVQERSRTLCIISHFTGEVSVGTVSPHRKIRTSKRWHLCRVLSTYIERGSRLTVHVHDLRKTNRLLQVCSVSLNNVNLILFCFASQRLNFRYS